MSRDGRVLVIGDAGAQSVRILDGLSGRASADAWHLPARLQAVAVHPAGGMVVFGFQEGFLQAYDPVTRRARGAAVSWPGRALALRFSPDGRTLYVLAEADGDQTITPVDPLTGLPLGPPLNCPGDDRVRGFAFDPTGRVLATGDLTGTVRFWEVPTPLSGDAAHVRRWVETSSRTELVTEPTEILQYLDDREVGQRRKRLREVWAGPPVGP
jgi:WD40 repeat protein